jgi:hypothetical protein
MVGSQTYRLQLVLRRSMLGNIVANRGAKDRRGVAPERQPHDPAGAAEVIGRMCAPRQSDRYATLSEALDDLAICEA